MLLQRGRARAGAEWAVRRLRKTSSGLMLQRGRARAGAEWRWPAGPQVEAEPRFNGAAPARARNEQMV